MREVAVSRFVSATPIEVRRALTPERVVEYEGSFQVRDVTETGGATLITAGATGLELTLSFEEREDGPRYVQQGQVGPFNYMETVFSIAAEDDGSRVTVRSTVSLGVPPAALVDRVAAWKRRGELERALDALADDLG